MAFRVQRGEIWHAHVPFTDDPDQRKHRPVVVLGFSRTGRNQDNVVLVVPVTSFGEGASPKEGDVELSDWANFGLKKPSWVRARRLWGADPRVFDQRRGPSGSVSSEVMSLILLEIQKLFR